jgi:hypothetical protein
MPTPIIVKPPPSYTTQALPVLEGGDGKYLQNELQRIKSVLDSYQDLLPQAASKAPLKPIDGMIRLSRDPWRPVTGTTVDALVYYDAAGAVWQLLGTPPTNT